MTEKLLLLGIDAMDPRIARTLMDRGALPNFARLRMCELRTTTPPETPVAWSAAATGCNPGRYAIFDFLSRDRATYLPRLNLAELKPGVFRPRYESAMKGVPFWRLLSGANVPVSVLRWPVTFPPEQIKGRMLSGLGAVDIKGGLGSYSFFTDDASMLEFEGAEKVSIVERRKGRYQGCLAGPLVRKGGRLAPVTVPIAIEAHDEGRASIRIGSSTFQLKVGEWSAIQRVSFRVRPFSRLSGICNCYLRSLEPHLMLYVSSIQLDPRRQAVPITAPQSYGKELAAAIGDFYTLGMAEDTKAVTEKKLSREAFLEQVRQVEAERERMFDFELARFQAGALAVVFDAGDRLKHIFWKNGSMDEPGRSVPPEIEWYYRDKDRLLGRVLDRIDADTRLIVMSDHGFSDFRRQVNVNTWLIREGYMSVRGEGNADLFGQVDWTATRAYAVGFTSLYLNNEGREAKGVVTARDRAELADEIKRKLLDLRDGEHRVFTNVYRSDEIYSGLYAGDAPDLVLGFAAGYRMAWRSAIGGYEAEVFADNVSDWQGDHLIDPSHVPGVLFTNFPIIKESPSLFDIAPTVLRILGVDVPQYMDGTSLVDR